MNYADSYLRTIGLKKETVRGFQMRPYPNGGKVKLFVFAGHRNMEGERAFTHELRELKGYESLADDTSQIAYKYSLGGSFKKNRIWEPLGPAGLYDTFGPELSFAKSVRGKATGQIAIAKFTHSGSQINDWTPEGTAAKDCNLYEPFIAFIRNAIKELRGKGLTVEVAGIFYHLGENDMAFFPYRKEAAKWLQTTVTQSREDLELPSLK